jgi:hypothetical protein
MTPTLALILIIAVTIGLIGIFVGIYRDRMNELPDQSTTALLDAAAALGLGPDGKDAYIGRLNGRQVRVAVDGGRGKKTGLRITVEDAPPFDGLVAVSGPTEGGGAGYGEAKILIGDGPFDYNFWVAREKPRGAAAELLLPHKDARTAMIDMPFGVWDFSGTHRSYHSYRIPPEQYQDVIRRAVDVMTQL